MAVKIQDDRQKYQKYSLFASEYIYIAKHLVVESKAYIMYKGLYLYFLLALSTFAFRQ